MQVTKTKYLVPYAIVETNIIQTTMILRFKTQTYLQSFIIIFQSLLLTFSPMYKINVMFTDLFGVLSLQYVDQQ